MDTKNVGTTASPSFCPYMFLHPSHLQLSEHPTPALEMEETRTFQFTIKQNRVQNRCWNNVRQEVHFWGQDLIAFAVFLQTPWPLAVTAPFMSGWWRRFLNFSLWKLQRFNIPPKRTIAKEGQGSLTPLPFPVVSTTQWTTLGANARWFRDSICCLALITISLHSGLFRHSLHVHESIQYTPAAKQSQ